ncbi:MAG TPA: copper resistance CopC family protein [Jiangellaceae bacterium]|nr:copper resistance CopC family protein [Jiangellaceae bacterium]
MDKVLRLAAAVAGAVFGLALVAAPAAAHTELIGSTPADKATVATPPAEVVLEFNQPVQTNFGQVAVLDANGAHHEQGDLEFVGNTVVQAVGALDAGAYEISYRVGSTDGHPITGTLSFTVTGPATTPEATPQASSRPAAPSPSPSDSLEGMDHDDDTSPTSEPVEATDADDGMSPLLLGAGGIAAAAALAAVVYFAMGGRGPRETEGGDGAETGP